MNGKLAMISHDFFGKLIPFNILAKLFNCIKSCLESPGDELCNSTIGSEILQLYDNNDLEEILHLAPKLLEIKMSPKDKVILLEILINSCVVYGKHEFIKQLLPQMGTDDEKKLKICEAKYHQSKGDYETAFRLMTGILLRYPTDVSIRKQTLSVLKNRIPINKYVDLINRHLSEFPLDTESWQELGEVYISAGHLNEAIYCYNELILHKPHNLFYIITIADLYYSIARYPLSYKYYSMAITMNPVSKRALWGLVLVYTRIVRNSKNLVECAAGDPQHLFSDVYKKVAKKAIEVLRAIYIKSKAYGAVRALNRLWNEWNDLEPID